MTGRRPLRADGQRAGGVEQLPTGLVGGALPPLLLLTDRHQAARPLVDVVRAAVDGGARAVVLREKDLPASSRATLAAQLRAVLSPVDGLLIVAGADPLAGPGVHLAAADTFPDPRPDVVGRSCHTRAELSAAAAEGVDYVTLSPVFLTESKPGYGPALGLPRLRELCGAADVPVYALGGVGPGVVAACRTAGATGVAVMGAVMRSADPASTVDKLLKEMR